MKRQLTILLLILLPASFCWPQSHGSGGNTFTLTKAGAFSGACAFNQRGIDTTNGDVYSCGSGNTWRLEASHGATCDSSGNCTISGTLTVSGLATFSGGALVGAGTPNEGTTGTDLNANAKFVNTAGVVQLQKCLTTDTLCFLVIKETSCAGGTGCTTGNAYVQGAFTETDSCSTACAVNKWVKASSGTGGQVMDTGVANTSPCPVSTTCLGFAMTAGTGPQTIVRLSPIVQVPAATSSVAGTVTVTGNTNVAVSQSGAATSGKCAQYDANGNLAAASVACGSSAATQILHCGANSFAVTGTKWVACGLGVTASATETDAYTVLATGGTTTALYAMLTKNSGANGDTIVVTARKCTTITPANSTPTCGDQSLTCTITAVTVPGTQSCTDTTVGHQFSWNAGDSVHFKTVCTGTCSATLSAHITVAYQ